MTDCQRDAPALDYYTFEAIKSYLKEYGAGPAQSVKGKYHFQIGCQWFKKKNMGAVFNRIREAKAKTKLLQGDARIQQTSA